VAFVVPRFAMLIWSPTANAVVELAGIVTEIAAAFVRVSNRPTSVSATVYAVPVWELIAMIDDAKILAFAAVNTSPVVKVGLTDIVLLS
jgi:hypothetical protein